jgi:M6 family metalloprotease-like protein
MSSPFHGKEFTFIQPDQTRIQVRGWGSQDYAIFETLEGFTIVKNPETGFYEYAQLSNDNSSLETTGIKVGEPIPNTLNLSPKLRPTPNTAKQQALAAQGNRPQRRCEIRRQEAKSAALNPPGTNLPHAAPPQQTRTGNYRGLCLLVEFPDDLASIPQQEVFNFCNQSGYRGYNNNGSVFDYFYDNSNGKLQYNNLVTPYYMAKHNKAYYTDESIQYGQRAQELILEALSYFKTQGFDFSSLSADNSSYIYALNVFYAGSCQNNWAKGLWPHASGLASPFPLASGKQFSDYQITNIGSDLSLGTFCHENGHMLCDFPDLYDYGNQSSGVGVYCLMCSGGVQDGKNPTQINAYLKYKAGWATSVTKITSGIQGTVPADKNDFFIYDNPNNQREYFIIENRYTAGHDASLPSAGIAIWHIDENGSNNNEQMELDRHYECSLEQADGRFDLERNRYNIGDAQDLFSAANNKRFADYTNPSSKWWNGTASGLEITDISVPGRSMTFRAPSPNGFKLKAMSNTVIKQSPISSQALAANKKFDLLAGEEIEIKEYHSAASNHWKIELQSPKNGVAKWFAYKPHIQIV